MCVVETDLAKHLARLDEADNMMALVEEIAEGAEAEFKAAIEAADMNRPMANTSRSVYHSDAPTHARKLGTRMCTFGEVIYDFMDDAEKSDSVLRALVLCAKKGNIEAIEVLDQIKGEYTKVYVAEQLKQGAMP